MVHRHSLAIFTADASIADNSAMGINFLCLNHKENRRELAIFYRKGIAHLGLCRTPGRSASANFVEKEVLL